MEERERPIQGSQVLTYMERRKAAIAKAAYMLAELRDFGPGSDEDDWREAERFVDAGLKRK